MIVDIEYLKGNVVNDELYQKCLDSSQTTFIQRLINIVESKVFLYIEKDQFKQDDNLYIFPDDLKKSTVYLIESLFLNKDTDLGKGKLKSYTEKFDDYSISKEYDSTNKSYEPVLFYGIPILPDYLDILNRYRSNSIARFGTFSIDIY